MLLIILLAIDKDGSKVLNCKCNTCDLLNFDLSLPCRNLCCCFWLLTGLAISSIYIYVQFLFVSIVISKSFDDYLLLITRNIRRFDFITILFFVFLFLESVPLLYIYHCHCRLEMFLYTAASIMCISYLLSAVIKISNSDESSFTFHHKHNSFQSWKIKQKHLLIKNSNIVILE